MSYYNRRNRYAPTIVTTIDDQWEGTTKFESRCHECRNPIAAGTKVVFTRSASGGKTKVHHLAGACGPKAPPPEMPSVESLVDAVAGYERVSTNFRLTGARDIEVNKKARDSFPGCKECWGEGRYEARWSMDAGCVETVICNKPEDAKRHAVGTYASWLKATGQAAEVETAHEEFVAAINEERLWTDRLQNLRWGDYVEVVKGRKVARGFYRVFWSGEGEFGARVGLLTPEGERVYTARSNVEARGLNWKRS